MFSDTEAWAWKVRIGFGALMVLSMAGCLLTS
jgi:hypothetical protein